MAYTEDPRISELVEKFSKESDPKKLVQLSRQLSVILEADMKSYLESDKSADAQIGGKELPF